MPTRHTRLIAFPAMARLPGQSRLGIYASSRLNRPFSNRPTWPTAPCTRVKLSLLVAMILALTSMINQAKATSPKSLVIGLPKTSRNTQGTLDLFPNVEVNPARKVFRYDLPTVADLSPPSFPVPLTGRPKTVPQSSLQTSEFTTQDNTPTFTVVTSLDDSESLPTPRMNSTQEILTEEYPGDSVEPLFTEMFPDQRPCQSASCAKGHSCGHCQGAHLPWRRRILRQTMHSLVCGHMSPEGKGIGYERVANAIFAIDTTQPQSKLGLQFGVVDNFRFPDRAEYFWARPQANGGKGPLPETQLDYQEVRFKWEVGGSKFTTMTELPIMALDPINNLNTAGQGDMTVTTKLLMLDGERWQITQLMRTFIPMASFKRGLSPGHASLEPGVLFRYKRDDRTFYHSQLKYWFAPGGNDPDYGGQILTYGFGVSRLWLDSDTFAIIPTAEIVGATILDGRKTINLAGEFKEIDTESPVDLHLGLRFINDQGGDMGLIEYGTVLSIGLTSERWYDSQFRFEVRWIY